MPRKLGQHFLINRAAVKKILESLELESGDAIIEIGPGKGALTEELASWNPAPDGRGSPQMQSGRQDLKIIGIEKDQRLVQFLQRKFTNNKNIKIVHGDILKILPNLTSRPSPLASYKLAGNIPYYITGRLLRILSELPHKPKLIVLTLQKEVAERITARPPKMNLLAAIAGVWASPKIGAYLKPQDFAPPPKVRSAIIKLIPRNQELGIRNQEQYFAFVKILFKQPRKTIFNNLRAGLKQTPKKILAILKSHGLAGEERPQNLDLNTLKKLSAGFNS